VTVLYHHLTVQSSQITGQCCMWTSYSTASTTSVHADAMHSIWHAG